MQMDRGALVEDDAATLPAYVRSQLEAALRG